MDVREAILTRRSIRKYKMQPVEQDKIQTILDSGRRAPTGHNTQPGRFVVVEDPDQIRKIGAACNNQPFVTRAPLLIVLLGDLSCRKKEAGLHDDILDPVYTDQREKVIRDTTIVGDHMALQAHALGLGVCWVGDFEQIPMRAVLESPASHYILAIFAIGYPDEEPGPRPRKEIHDLVSYNTFGQKK